MKKLSVLKLKAMLAKMKSERGTWESHWQEVSDYFVPRKSTITVTRTPGSKTTWDLLDSVGVNSNELLAGFLHSLLTNPDLPWFELTTGDMELDSKNNVRLWLQKQARKMHSILNNSNFQTEVHEMYIDLPSIGTSCMTIEPDDDAIIRFCTKFITDFYIKENSKGFIDTIFMEWKSSAAELIKEFGDTNMPPKVKKAFADGKEDLFCVVHAIYPKYLVEPKAKKIMNFNSQFFLPELDHEVDSGEFKSFPALTPRWSKGAGEQYGRSCAMNALPEAKVLNKMNETMLIGAQKMVDPPLQLPDDGFIMPIVTTPGGLNYYRSGTNDMIRPVFNDTRMDFGYQQMEDRRNRVRDCFYVNQLRLQQGGPMMTATEVLQRSEEATRLLGPMLGRMHSEFLKPLIDRLFEIMLDKGLIEPAPEEIQGKELKVRYSSLIAKSQRAHEGNAAMQWLSASAPFLNIDQTAADLIDAKAAIKSLGVIFGTPEEFFRSEKDVAAIVKARADAQANAQAAVQQQNQVDNSLTVAKAMKETQGMNG